MKKRNKIISIIAAAAIVMLSGAVAFSKDSVVSAQSNNTAERFSGFAADNWLSHDSYKELYEVNLDEAIGDAGNTLTLEEGESVQFNLKGNISDTAALIFDYKVISPNSSDCIMYIQINDESYSGTLPVLWYDEAEEYKVDRYGNQIASLAVAYEDAFVGLLNDNSDIDKSPLQIPVDAASTVMTLTSASQTVEISSIKFVKLLEPTSYDEYIKAYKNAENGGMFVIEAEDYAVKNSLSISNTNVKNAALYPYDTYKKVINCISSSWSNAGQQIAWEFEVEKDGLYDLSFRYSQAAATNMPVYRTIAIDGVVPFAEMNEVMFPQTDSGEYANFTVTVDGKPAKVYLTKGKHSISMQVTMGPLKEQYLEIKEVMNRLNKVGMDLKKLTAGSTDTNRTWDLDAYLPNVVPELKSCADKIDEIYDNLEKIGGLTPSYANSLTFASETLRKVCKKPRQLPNKIDKISSGDGSAANSLASVISSMVSLPISLDRIYVGDSSDLPRASVSFLYSIKEAMKSFAYSFTPAAVQGTAGADDDSEDSLEIWVARSAPYVEILRQLCDESFTTESGTPVNLSIMPSEQKLILSNAAGTSPDMVLGVGYSTPFNLAIRGAAKNLLEYDDFLEYYNKEYNIEALVPVTYGDGVYGAIETQDFRVLFYRKDILESLGLSVPETWDDIKEMMPTLLRHSMNVYLPLSASGAYKGMTVTGPYLHQNNADFYAQNGMSVEITSDAAMKAFKEMTNIYKIYGADKAVPSFYNSFRYGDIPLGIDGFSMYLTLELAAPELAGLWDIALCPGTRQEDGSILRYQSADATACMIMKSSKKSDEAYEFMKWWLASSTQTSFANSLQNILGSEYRWNTANLVSMKSMPYSENARSIILEQWKSQKEIINHPANYMVEREVSNVWNDVVVNGYGLVESLDNAAIISNREIIRKMKEFGFVDNNENIISNYTVASGEMLREKLEKGK